jgi:hypothetical protein
MPGDRTAPTGPADAAARRAERRLRGFRIHLGVFAGLAIAAVVTMLLVDPRTPWILLPLVGWGPVLALHVAYVMGLFDRLRPARRPGDDRQDTVE